MAHNRLNGDQIIAAFANRLKGPAEVIEGAPGNAGLLGNTAILLGNSVTLVVSSIALAATAREPLRHLGRARYFPK
jgi:hypothetical protein